MGCRLLAHRGLPGRQCSRGLKAPHPVGGSQGVDLQPPILQVDASGPCLQALPVLVEGKVLSPTAEMDITPPGMGFSPSHDSLSPFLTPLPGVTSPLNDLHGGLVSCSVFGGTQTKTVMQALVGMRRNSVQGAQAERTQSHP